MGVFTALLDTNVLWPSLLRDFLLSLAVEGLYRPVWSEAILEELHDCEVTKLTRRGVERSEARARAVQLIEQMRTLFDDAVVTGWEGLDGAYGLPDPDDEHVLVVGIGQAVGAVQSFPSGDHGVVEERAHLFDQLYGSGAGLRALDAATGQLRDLAVV